MCNSLDRAGGLEGLKLSASVAKSRNELHNDYNNDTRKRVNNKIGNDIDFGIGVACCDRVTPVLACI